MITFVCEYSPTGNDERQLFVCGSSPALGAWQVEKAVPLKQAPNGGDLWRCDVAFARSEKGQRIDYKYLKASSKWETLGGTNRSLVVPMDGNHEKFDGSFDSGSFDERPLTLRNALWFQLKPVVHYKRLGRRQLPQCLRVRPFSQCSRHHGKRRQLQLQHHSLCNEHRI
jgi:hypothetical protein